MAINLVDRLPIPGSLGAPVDQGISVTLRVTGGGTIPLPSVSIYVSSVTAYENSVFKNDFSGTVVSDGMGGWVFQINPLSNLAYDTLVPVQVNCVEQPGAIVFSQTYSFKTIRNIQLSASAEYTEDGDVVTFVIYPYENDKTVTSLIQSGSVRLYNPSAVPDIQPVLLDEIKFTNDRNTFSSDGTFNIRFLHPFVVKNGITYEIVLNTDPYQAPNVNSVQLSGVVTYTPRNVKIVEGQNQPYPQGEIHRPRVEYEGVLHKTFQIDDADYQSVNLESNSQLPDILVDVDFLGGVNYAKILNGDVTYSGGGNRLLHPVATNTKYLLQNSDVFAPVINAKTVIEPLSNNYFPNSAFLGTTNPFSLGGTDSKVITESSLVTIVASEEDVEVPLVKAAAFVFEGMAIYDGTTRHAWATSPKVAYAAGNDVLISSLVRIAYRDAVVTLTNFTLKAQFFNSSDSMVYSTNVIYNPRDFVSENIFSLAEIFVPSASIPVTATKVCFTIDIDSFESCDRIEMYLLGPSIEFNTSYTTSRVVSAELVSTRKSDTISISQIGNINIERGMFVIDFISAYDGAPPVDITFFDSRLPITQTNGFVARHLASGFVEFSVVDSSGTTKTITSTSPVNLVSNEITTFTFAWQPDLIFIKKNADTVQTYAGAYNTPAGINTDISIGRNSNSQEFMLSELHRFRIYSRPVS